MKAHNIAVRILSFVCGGWTFLLWERDYILGILMMCMSFCVIYGFTLCEAIVDKKIKVIYD